LIFWKEMKAKEKFNEKNKHSVDWVKNILFFKNVKN
jgi:hypothetical protein